MQQEADAGQQAPFAQSLTDGIRPRPSCPVRADRGAERPPAPAGQRTKTRSPAGAEPPCDHAIGGRCPPRVSARASCSALVWCSRRGRRHRRHRASRAGLRNAGWTASAACEEASRRPARRGGRRPPRRRSDTRRRPDPADVRGRDNSRRSPLHNASTVRAKQPPVTQATSSHRSPAARRTVPARAAAARPARKQAVFEDVVHQAHRRILSGTCRSGLARAEDLAIEFQEGPRHPARTASDRARCADARARRRSVRAASEMSKNRRRRPSLRPAQRRSPPLAGHDRMAEAQPPAEPLVFRTLRLLSRSATKRPCRCGSSAGRLCHDASVRAAAQAIPP